jgi:hypothetical protein
MTALHDFRTLEIAIQRVIALAVAVCLILLMLTIACFAFTVSAVHGAHEIEQKLPVLVVPGAVAGVYTPGITEDNVRATARYLANLATNFGAGKSFGEHFDELESFSSPVYLPHLQRARALLAHDVEVQNQSRSFFAAPASEHLEQALPGHFDYAIRGERVVYASGLPMDSHQSEVRLRLQWGVPSMRNRAGVVLERIDVVDTEPRATPGLVTSSSSSTPATNHAPAAAVPASQP